MQKNLLKRPGIVAESYERDNLLYGLINMEIKKILALKEKEEKSKKQRNKCYESFTELTETRLKKEKSQI